MIFSRFFAVMAFGLLLAPLSAIAQTCPQPTGTPCGATITTATPVQLLPAVSAGTRLYHRVVNSGTTSEGTAWCTRGTGNPTVNGAGSFPLAPWGNSLGLPSGEEYLFAQGGPPLPPQALTCISDGGTSGTAPAIMSVETR